MNEAEFISRLETIERQIVDRYIKMLSMRGVVDLGLVTFTDFATITADLGIEELVAEYVEGIGYFARFGELVGFGKIEALAQDFEIIKAARFDQLITKVNANLKAFRSTMGELLTGDIDKKILLADLKLIKQGEIGMLGLKPITDAQLNTAISTATANFNRIVTKKVFEDKPEQRFEYVGGIIPTSSEQCSWLMDNQKPEGYTMAEIQAGVQTPAGEINQFGRVPNYNCIHSWLPIDTPEG